MAQVEGSQAAEIPPYLEEGLPFGQSGPSTDCTGPTHTKAGSQLYSLYQLKVKGILNYPQGNTQKNIWAPSFSVKLTHKIYHHNTQRVTGPNINTGDS